MDREQSENLQGIGCLIVALVLVLGGMWAVLQLAHHLRVMWE